MPSHLFTSVTASSNLWNSHLGHASLQLVQLLASKGHLCSIDLNLLIVSIVTLGNNHIYHLVKVSLFRLHLLIWSILIFEGGSHYFVIFVDEYFRYT